VTVTLNPFDRDQTTLVPIGSAYSVTLGKMLDAGKAVDDGHTILPYIRAANIQDDGLRLGDVNEMPFSDDEAARLNLRRGDLLVVEGGSVGTSVVLEHDMAGWSFQKTVNRVRPIGDWSTRYLGYVLRAYRDAGVIDLVCNGSTIPHLTAEKLKALRIPTASPNAQRAIADYLDRETARIDTLIEEQQRLIDMLHERRFALRTHVALHGTTSAEEIESALPWALRLPAHWRVVPLTSVADLESGHTPSRSREDWWTDCYIPWVSLHDVGTMRGTKYLQDTAQHISDAGIANSSARLLPARTVVLSRDATVGRTAIMGIPMATSQHFAAWICGPLLDPEYLWVLFQDAMQPFFDSFQNGSTIRTIGMGDLKAFRIPLPPLDEQRRIVAYLDDETTKIDALIAETERFIELARERRLALITAAVTEQIDVREMA
jgi:type I restriction enzyme S subunit